MKMDFTTEKKEPNSGRSRKVYQLDRNYEVVNIFDSTRKAGKFLKKQHSAISEVARGKRKTAYGFFWIYAEDYEYLQKSAKKRQRKIQRKMTSQKYNIV